MNSGKILISVALISIQALVLLIIPTLAYSENEQFNYDSNWCNTPLLNATESKLYLSLGYPDKVVEIDTNTMNVIRNFQIETPYQMMLSNDDTYLFVESISEWPNSYLCRIRLSDGYIDSIGFNGHTADFTMNSDGDSIWVSYYTFPAPGVPHSVVDALTDHPGSALIAKISTDNFSIVETKPAAALPSCIWYSNYSGDIFNTYDWITIYLDRTNGAAIDVFDGDSLICVGKLIGGDTAGNRLWIPSNLCNWTDDGHFAAVPNLTADMNKCSLKIIDTTRTTNFKNFEPYLLLTFNHPINGEILGTEFLKKVPGTNIMWATSDDGNPPDDPDRARYVIKINTSTHEYEVFEIPEATSPFGHFDVSSDGRILYLTQPETGSVIKCAPGNHSPSCSIQILTPMPYQGTCPALIQFHAFASDEDNDQLTYHWDFDGDTIYDEPGDDSYTGPPQNPIHEFIDDGVHDVFLKVTDNYQGECISLVTVMIEFV